MQQSQCREMWSCCKICRTRFVTNQALIGCCSKFASLVSIHIMILPLKNKLWSGHVYWAHCRIWLATIGREHCRRLGREGKDKRRGVAGLWSSKRFESMVPCDWDYLSMSESDVWWSQCVLFGYSHEILIASRSHLGSSLGTSWRNNTEFMLRLNIMLNFFVWLFVYFECAAPDVFALLHT